MRRARWSVASANGNETMCLGGCVGKAFDVTDARDAPGQRRVSRAPELPRLGAHAHHRPNDAGEHRAGLSRRPCRRCARSAVALIFRREKTTTPRVRRRGGLSFPAQKILRSFGFFYERRNRNTFAIFHTGSPTIWVGCFHEIQNHKKTRPLVFPAFRPRPAPARLRPATTLLEQLRRL